MNRTEMWRRIEKHPNPWDMIVVGGGATGVGVAIDAASRGYHVLLLEQSDFGKGTFDNYFLQSRCAVGTRSLYFPNFK
jgi:glycerol-3-phosphate dehydrogenase